MILLKRGISENCGSSSDPRPDVKRGSAFGRSYEASPMQQGKSREISSPGYTGQVGLLDDNNTAGWKPRGQLVQKRKCSTALQAFQPRLLPNDASGICRIIAVNDTNSNYTCSDFSWCSGPLGAILAHPTRKAHGTTTPRKNSSGAKTDVLSHPSCPLAFLGTACTHNDPVYMNKLKGNAQVTTLPIAQKSSLYTSQLSIQFFTERNLLFSNGFLLQPLRPFSYRA